MSSSFRAWRNAILPIFCTGAPVHVPSAHKIMKVKVLYFAVTCVILAGTSEEDLDLPADVDVDRAQSPIISRVCIPI